MFMFKKLKEISNGIKSGIKKPSAPESENDTHRESAIDQKDKDFVKRKLKFEEMQNVLDTEGDCNRFYQPGMDMRI